jgi:uncharacterized protein YjbI with pentapeptide repeats
LRDANLGMANLTGTSLHNTDLTDAALYDTTLAINQLLGAS